MVQHIHFDHSTIDTRLRFQIRYQRFAIQDRVLNKHHLGSLANPQHRRRNPPQSLWIAFSLGQPNHSDFVQRRTHRLDYGRPVVNRKLLAPIQSIQRQHSPPKTDDQPNRIRRSLRCTEADDPYPTRLDVFGHLHQMHITKDGRPSITGGIGCKSNYRLDRTCHERNRSILHCEFSIDQFEGFCTTTPSSTWSAETINRLALSSTVQLPVTANVNWYVLPICVGIDWLTELTCVSPFKSIDRIPEGVGR